MNEVFILSLTFSDKNLNEAWLFNLSSIEGCENEPLDSERLRCVNACVHADQLHVAASVRRICEKEGLPFHEGTK